MMVGKWRILTKHKAAGARVIESGVVLGLAILARSQGNLGLKCKSNDSPPLKDTTFYHIAYVARWSPLLFEFFYFLKIN
jgi:hypothetical protein